MVVGWYHSHPGFGCWLSGVDINTQQVGPILTFSANYCYYYGFLVIRNTFGLYIYIYIYSFLTTSYC